MLPESIEPKKPENYKITYKKPDSLLEKLPSIEGLVYNNLIDLKNHGFQGSNLYESYNLLRYAIDNQYKIILGFTTNAISCGMRQIITKFIDVAKVSCVVTTMGAIEEDLMKTHVPFNYKGDLQFKDSILRDYGINRTQNIYCSNQCYVWFEKYLQQKAKSLSNFYHTNPIKLCRDLVEGIQDPQSLTLKCIEKNILLIPLTPEDGAIGDHFAHVYYTKLAQNQQVPNINSAISLPTFLNFLHKDEKKVCVIILGGGASKHFIMNGLITKNGADITLFFNNGNELDGSNASATTFESISWGKTSPEGYHKKVHGDFTITAYLLFSQIIRDLNQTT